jgi:DNA-binding NarL/FixJ family response regulator
MMKNYFACLCAGANGYLLKKTSPARLFDAIEEVMEGGAPMSPVLPARCGFIQSKKANAAI